MITKGVEIDREGRGIRKLFAPFARRHAAREIPRDQDRLKGRLESGV
jgi:hypothetical protein